MPTPAQHPLLIAAREWHDAGFAVIPSHEDGSKRPFGPWKQYQSTRPTWDQVEGWLSSDRYTGIGVLTGQASGGAEMVELEGPMDAAVERLNAVMAKAREFGDAGVQDLLLEITRGCVEESAGGGLHLFIVVTDGPALGNTKLAMSADGKVIAETRGEGGFVIVAPTTARNGHREGTAYLFANGGHPSKTVHVTAEQRDMMHLLFSAALDQAPVPVAPAVAPTPPSSTYEGTSALDAFRATPWAEILVPAGWTYSHSDTERDYWVRPGKTVAEGTSASTIEDGPMVNFSTSLGNWPTDVGMSKGQVYALLHHGGDVSAAARDLSAQGFGDAHTVAPLPAWEMPEQGSTEPPTLTAEDRDLHALAVARKYAELRILEDARGLLATSKVGAAPDLNAHSLADFLAEPDQPQQYRVDGLWPAEGRVLLAAAAKSGKTTMVAANLLPSLVDGRQFLGRYDAQKVSGRVVLLNMEVGENTLRRWMRDAGIDNTDAVSVANLRGKGSALTLATEQGRERVAAFLRSLEAEVVILDPLAPVLASLGLDENSNADVAQFFAWWSEALHLAGVADDLVVHHAGHAGQRSRGASRLLDEPDAVWTLTREADEDSGEFSRIDPVRYLSAFGRDVEMPPEALAFDPVDKSLALTGKDKAEMKGERRVNEVLAAFDKSPISKATIKERVKGNGAAVGKLVDELVARGVLTETGRGPTGYRLLFPVDRLETS